jgi:integral membrane sensor domain MASE1
MGFAVLSLALHAASALLSADRASASFDPVVGLLLGAWIRRPMARWPEIALAALVGGAVLAMAMAGRLTLEAPQTVAFGVASTAAGALAIRRLTRDSLSLGRVGDVGVLVGLASIATCVAAFGTAALASPDFSVALAPFRDGWASGLLGALLVAPALLVLRDARLRDTLASARARLEFAALACAIFASAYATYFASAPFSLPRGVPALLVVWASFRFRPRGAVLAIALLAATVLASISRASLATIPSLGSGPATGAWEIEAFLSLSFVTALVLAALSEERAQLIEHLEREVNVLRGLLPICSHCKKIRDDESHWHPVESYIQSHSEATFTHGICPACLEKHYGELLGPED